MQHFITKGPSHQPACQILPLSNHSPVCPSILSSYSTICATTPPPLPNRPPQKKVAGGRGLFEVPHWKTARVVENSKYLWVERVNMFPFLSKHRCTVCPRGHCVWLARWSMCQCPDTVQKRQSKHLVFWAHLVESLKYNTRWDIYYLLWQANNHRWFQKPTFLLSTDSALYCTTQALLFQCHIFLGGKFTKNKTNNNKHNDVHPCFYKMPFLFSFWSKHFGNSKALAGRQAALYRQSKTNKSGVWEL